MSLLNLRDRTIDAKIVYYGTALSGKTTSLRHVHRVVDPDGRTELVSLNTEGDRTLFFDYLPIALGRVGDFDLRLQAFTVPGQAKYELTRRFVLRGADAVIFVADSSPDAAEANVAALESLCANLETNGISLDQTPLAIQFNKRDVPGALPLDVLRAALNPGGLPEFATIATDGTNVFEAFTEAAAAMVAAMAREYRLGDEQECAEQVRSRLTDISAASAASTWQHGVPIGARESSVVEVAADLDPEETPDIEALLASAVDTHIETARLVSELHETRRDLAERAQQLAALHETGIILNSELDPRRLVGRVLERALSTVGAEHGSVLRVDADTGRVQADVVRGYDRDPLVDAGEAVPELVAHVLGGAPLTVTPASHPRLFAAPSPAGPAPTVALLAPLVHQGEALGCLAAYLVADPGAEVAAERLQFLAALASQAAVATANARLVARIEAFNRDLERKVRERTSELRRAYRELQTLDGMKDDFVASMSHELLTPLTSVSGFAEILETTAGETGEDAVANRREFASIIRHESGRLTRLVQSVLDLTALESGRVELDKREVVLRAALQESYRRQRAHLKRRDVKVRVRVEEGMPPVVADPHWLGRLFDVVLSNAGKFAPEGGEVAVSIRSARGAATVEVADRGPGLTEAQLSSVFEKFKQAGEVLTDKPDGLGLGLPTARLIAEAHGGRIWYEPGVPSGSSFLFSIPVATATVV